jgi:Big-like domain-containing protein
MRRSGWKTTGRGGRVTRRHRALAAAPVALALAGLMVVIAGASPAWALGRRTVTATPGAGKPGVSVTLSGAGVPPDLQFSVYYEVTSTKKVFLCGGNNMNSDSWHCGAKIPAKKDAGAYGTHRLKMTGTAKNGTKVTALGDFGLCRAGPAAGGCTTSTGLTAAPNPATTGQQVTYTATVSPAPMGGTVEFTDGGNPVGGCQAVLPSSTTGQATCLVTYSVAGSHSIVAIYSGAKYYLGSTSHSVTETVN